MKETDDKRNYTTMELLPEAQCIYFQDENATRENMIAYLQKETGLEHIVTFGSMEGRYDILVQECDHNKVVRTLKKMYEPLVWEPKLKEKIRKK